MSSDTQTRMLLQRPKGTQDIIGETAAHWRDVEQLCRTQFQQAAYQEIRTPVFESADLFERGVGEGTDIVNKEMYVFEKGERRLALRPEGTAGVVRAYVEQGLSRRPKPVRLFYMGPMFRYERPQAGRQRQFHQIGVELFGLDAPAADAEVILLAMRLFESLGLDDLSLEINNIGMPECRQRFKEELKERLREALPQLCEDCRTRYEVNPLRLLDCKQTACQAIYARPDIRTFLETDFTSEACQAHFSELTGILDALCIPYRRNFHLVRGLDYYTKTVFEISTGKLGAQNTVCGGGRYNRLVSDLGGPETPAVGWALGMERLMSLVTPPPPQKVDFYIVTDQLASAFHLADRLRDQAFTVDVDLSGKGFGKQLEHAARINAAHAVILGSAEVEGDTVQVKNMETGRQIALPRVEFLQNTTTMQQPGRLLS